MNEIFFTFTIPLIEREFVLTGWKTLGFIGMALFASRWFVQMYYSRKAGQSILPRAFWFMSITGSTLCIIYFTFGKVDSIGLLQNLFPATVSAYNIYLGLKNGKPHPSG